MSQSAHGMQDIVLTPGVNTQLTMEANQAGISVSQQIRFKTGLAQKLGGWTNYYPTPVSSTPIRDVHGFQGFTGQKFIAAGSQTNLVVVSCGILSDITPQQNLNVFQNVKLSATSGSNIVTITDPSLGLSGGIGQLGSVYLAGNFISLGSGVTISSGYGIVSVLSSETYQIAIDNLSPSTFSSVAIGSNSSSPPYQMSFAFSSGSNFADVFFVSAPFQAGSYYNFGNVFVASTAVTLPLQVTSIIDSTHFQINIGFKSQVTISSQVSANIIYYQTQSPTLPFLGYGTGNYSSGAYGIGIPPPPFTGTPITVNDWSLDNAGNYLIAVPQNGPLYYWSVETGFSTAQVTIANSSPVFNRGGFVTQPQQIVMMFGSTDLNGVQNPLLARWSDSINFLVWIPSPTNSAGSFRIPTGSLLVGGLQAPQFAVLWTDVDVWTATWVGQPLLWAWLRIGDGCGLIGQHAADVQQGVVYWCGPTNFYVMSNGVQPLPCTVWDFFFDNLDPVNKSKVRATSNSLFNELAWFFPLSPAACLKYGIAYTGENNAYVKLHVGEGNEYEWDYGFLSRTAWIDTTALGPPIGTDGNGNLLQHETSFDATGTPINAYFETGYFAIGDGSDLMIVDYVLPDIRWQAGSATSPGTLLFTFYTTDYPSPETTFSGGALPGERQYGPYTVTQTTQFINTRMRGRFWRCRIESNDLGTFWRIGKIKFRWGAAGRR